MVTREKLQGLQTGIKRAAGALQRSVCGAACQPLWGYRAWGSGCLSWDCLGDVIAPEDRS